MDVTPEMRQAVYDADCADKGHQLDPYSGIKFNNGRQSLESTDEFKLPHIVCTRCGHVWIIGPADGANYEDVERLLYLQLNPNRPMAKVITRFRAKRDERGNPGGGNPGGGGGQGNPGGGGPGGQGNP